MNAVDPKACRRLELINVCLDTGMLTRKSPAEWLGQLAAELPRTSAQRIIFLPPMTPNFGALSGWAKGWSLSKANMLASILRPLRSVAAGFAYKNAGWNEIPWAIMHDRTEDVFRRHIGEFARKTGSTVLTTALTGLPRPQWKDWSEQGHLYHAARAIAPNGEPSAFVRQFYPDRWAFLKPLHVSGGLRPEEWAVIDLGGTPTRIAWDGPVGEGVTTPLIWIPRATTSGTPWPRHRQPAEILRRSRPSTVAAVQTCLNGRAGEPLVGRNLCAIRGPQGETRMDQGQSPGASGFSWQRVQVSMLPCQEGSRP